MEEVNQTIVQIRDFAIVAIALMGFVVLLGNVIKTIKEWGKPKVNEAEWKRDVDANMKDNNERIDSLEKGNKVICKALMAMMSHEINGNSISKLQKAYDEMNEYLIER